MGTPFGTRFRFDRAFRPKSRLTPSSTMKLRSAPRLRHPVHRGHEVEKATCWWWSKASWCLWLTNHSLHHTTPPWLTNPARLEPWNTTSTPHILQAPYAPISSPVIRPNTRPSQYVPLRHRRWCRPRNRRLSSSQIRRRIPRGMPLAHAS